MLPLVQFQMEVVGCPTVCQHCWAQGVPYPAMPASDVASVLEQAAQFFSTTVIPFVFNLNKELCTRPTGWSSVSLFVQLGLGVEKLAHGC